MKIFKPLILVITSGIWGPLWALNRLSRIIQGLVIATVISGCATNSASLEKSPCACDFTPANTPNVENSNV